MRVTAEAKTATRRRILDSARKLFFEKGFEQTTTRDIAAAAQIATGTLFNYFPTKEALAMTLFCDALDGVGDECIDGFRGDEMLEESLFAHVVAGLRRLLPFRSYVGPVIESTLSPFAKANCCEAADRVRVGHMETVAELLRLHAVREPVSFVAVHLYWTLYMGVLAFWSADDSPNQEDTFVLLDQSMRLFVVSLGSAGSAAAPGGWDGGGGV